MAILDEIVEENLENIQQSLVDKININFQIALDIKAEAETIIDRFDTISTQHINSPTASSNSHTGISTSNPFIDNNYKMSAVQLPHFDGQHEEWPSFADSFQSLIERNPDIRDIQKIGYLKSCLSGSAEEKIRPFKITADNYPIAWTTLREYYGNPLVLITKHVQAIWKGPLIDDKFPE
ncbi:hypothetical protein M0804_013746 [Polistes exclamans]|nr:hypothetical protein M0804_013746 [Polistes exclamans]